MSQNLQRTASISEITAVVAANASSGLRTKSTSASVLPPRSSASPARETLTEDGLPHCDHCNDLRSIRADVPVGHPDFGRLIPCPACGELALRQRRQQIYRSRRKRIQRYTQRAGRALRQTFENFDPRKAEGSCAVMIRKAQAAAQKFAQAPRGWLILYGTKGTGKSHLAAAIANHLETLPEAASPLVMFLTCPDLLDLLRSGYSVGDYEDLLYLCRTVDVLIVDDLGVERENDYDREAVPDPQPSLSGRTGDRDRHQLPAGDARAEDL